jgi:hypothetical protein
VSRNKWALMEMHRNSALRLHRHVPINICLHLCRFFDNKNFSSARYPSIPWRRKKHAAHHATHAKKPAPVTVRA